MIKNNIDNLLPVIQRENPLANSFEIHFPTNEYSAIYVEIEKNKNLHYNNDYLFYDPYNLQESDPKSIYGKYDKASFADKIIRMNYDIHVGEIGGIARKK